MQQRLHGELEKSRMACLIPPIVYLGGKAFGWSFAANFLPGESGVWALHARKEEKVCLCGEHLPQATNLTALPESPTSGMEETGQGQMPLWFLILGVPG